MRDVAGPSTDWREEIAPDESERFERHGEYLRSLQLRHARRHGLGRGLHYKQHAAAEGELEILDGLPQAARAGLFARPGIYRVYVRFSNAVGYPAADWLPDLRGAAIKVRGVEGRKLIAGMLDARTQDFLMFSRPHAPLRDVDEFIAFVRATTSKTLAAPRLLRAFGPRRTLTLGRYIVRELWAVRSMATTRFYSGSPVMVGEHAARYGLIPRNADQPRHPRRRRGYLAADLRERLAAGPLRFDFALQFYTDPQRTPIEDHSRPWDAPWTTVARLEIPAQDVESERGHELAKLIAGLSFDPWHALEAHRPLGNIMRARNAVYRLSTQARGATPEPVN